MSFDFQIDAEPEWFESSDDETPIHSFGGLKKLLTDMGYNVGKAQAYKPIEVADVSLEEIKNGTIEFADDGIFVNTDGVRRQVFLYKRSYRLELYGKPRFHIRKCSTIEEFMHSDKSIPEYRRANTSKVWVRDMDDSMTDKEVDNLPLCKNCLRIAAETYHGMTSADFVEILKSVDESEPEENVEVDIFGYTKDWEQISKAYREIHDYTCENCGLHITDPFDQQYIHTHHRNARKTDNRTSNLQCLCIRCHAAIDEFHKERFNSGANKILLDEFNAKYPPKPTRNVAKQSDTDDDDLPF